MPASSRPSIASDAVAAPVANSLAATNVASNEPTLSTTETGATRVRVSWPHFILSLIGLGVAAYAWYEHGVVKAGGETGCSISQVVSCDEVIGSKYGELFGLPVGAYGMLYFAIVLVTAISTAPGLAGQRSALLQRLGVTTVGVCCSAIFTYISVRIIGKICPICMATHTTTLLLFCTSLWQTFKFRQDVRLEG